MNLYGDKFRLSIFGESHGELIGVTLDGVPCGMSLSISDFKDDLQRRKSGAKGTTSRTESDEPEIVSGLYNGFTTGAPLTVIFRNRNTKSSDYKAFECTPRPGHADFVASVKYMGFNDSRGGGHFSGRLTLCLVAAGVVAKKMLGDIRISSRILEVGGVADSSEFERVISSAQALGDSVGGVVECECRGVKVGLGEPFFESIESKISHLVFSIPAIRGVEFGDGFSAARMLGSQHNDLIVDNNGKTPTNSAGGINGGIANGSPIVFRVAVKPTSSIAREQMTCNFESGKIEPLSIEGRHDSCIALRAQVVVEAVAAIALANC